MASRLAADWFQSPGYLAANDAAKRNFPNCVLIEGQTWPPTGTYYNIDNLSTTYDAAALHAAGTHTVGSGIVAIPGNYLIPAGTERDSWANFFTDAT